MAGLTDGMMPLEDGFTVERLNWQKSPLYRLVKNGNHVAYFDCLKAALGAYKVIHRTSIQPSQKMLDAVRRAESYAKEWDR